VDSGRLPRRRRGYQEEVRERMGVCVLCVIGCVTVCCLQVCITGTSVGCA
jgi:hypothetical protein